MSSKDHRDDTSGKERSSADTAGMLKTRAISRGEPVEVTFKFVPGTISACKGETLLQAIATGQVQTSGAALTPKEVHLQPAAHASASTIRTSRRADGTGPAASLIDRVKTAHVIAACNLRQIAILNHVKPF
jgi:hypothetical protein